MSFLLDTNACIAVISERPNVIQRRFQEEMRRGAEMFLSTIALHELWFGAANSARREGNAERIEALGARLAALPFDDEDARTAGYVRADLRKAGRPIGPYDLLIAVQALRRHLTLVTANTREFARVPGLRLENWAA